MNKEYKYDAFISYRHISPDKEIADKLQRMLENYKIPKQFRTGKKSKWHIFRDETELPTSGNLSGGIQEALETSNYLIVICSPSTQKSKWCMEEITKFKKLHNGSNAKIITVLADGTPDEVFPPELCTETYQELDEKGNTVYKERAIEPLAANVTAQSVKKSLKKLKSEFLRIAAPLLGCGYDALYKREHKKQVRKIITVGCAVIIASFAFLAYTGAMLFKINNQRIELAMSNASLVEKTRLLQIENSKNLSRISEDMWKEGDGIGAVETLLPSIQTADARQAVSPEALYVMADITGAFDIRGVQAVLNLEHETPVKLIGYAGNGKTIVTQDDIGVYFHSAQNGKLIKKYGEEELGTSTPTVYFENDGVIKTSAAKNHAGSSIMIDNYMFLGYQKVFEEEENLSGSDVFITGYNHAFRIDGVSGEIISEMTHSGIGSAVFSKTAEGFVKSLSEYGNSFYTIERFDEYGNTLGSYLLKDFDFGLLSEKWVHFGDKKCYCIKRDFSANILYSFDIEDNEIKNPTALTYEYEIDKLYTLDSPGVRQAKHLDGDLIVLNLYPISLTDYDAEISVYDSETALLKYSHVINGVSYFQTSNTGKIYAKNGGNYTDIIFVAFGDRVILINAQNGELIKDIVYDGTITASYSSLDGFLYLITSEGHEIITPIRKISAPITNPNNLSKYKTDTSFGKHDICAYYNNFYAMCAKGSKTVTVYTNSLNKDYTEIYFSDNQTANNVLANSDGTYALIDNYKELFVYDFSSGTMKLIDEFPDYGMKCGFVDNTTAFSIYKGEISFYDLINDDVLSVSVEGGIYDYNAIPSKGLIVYKDSDFITLLNKNGECEVIDKQDIAFCLDEKIDYISLRNIYVPEKTEKIFATLSVMSPTSYDTIIKLVSYDIFSKSFTYMFDITDEHGDIKHVKSLGDKKYAVIFHNSNMLYFDAEAGNVTDTVKYDLPIMVSYFHLDTNTALILSNDSCLYKLNLSEKSITAKIDLNNDRIKTASYDYSEFTYIPEKDIVILEWNDIGYVIDMKTFEPMYSIDYYEDYLTSTDCVIAKQHGHIGYYPLYTIEELAKKAEAYLGMKD